MKEVSITICCIGSGIHMYRDLSPKQCGGGYRLQYTYFSNLAARTRLMEPPSWFQCSCPGVGEPGNKGNMRSGVCRLKVVLFWYSFHKQLQEQLR